MKCPSDVPVTYGTNLAWHRKGKCLVFLDVLVIGRTLKEHLFSLRRVFGQLSIVGLQLKPSKWKFVQHKIEFLGYMVSEEGISADPENIQAIIEYPSPTDKTGKSIFGSHLILPLL